MAAGLLLTFALDRRTGAAPVQHLYYLPIRATRLAGGSLWMLVLDLDRLKSLNDTYGHLTGAEAVRHEGHILGSRVPADAVACRYGGDEFAVSLAGRTEADVRAIAIDLCRTVNASAPVLAGTPFPTATLSISVGVAHRSWAAWAAGEAMNSETVEKAGEALFRAADSALYGAKSRGRNQVFVAPDSAAPAVTATSANPGASPRAFSG